MFAMLAAVPLLNWLIIGATGVLTTLGIWQTTQQREMSREQAAAIASVEQPPEGLVREQMYFLMFAVIIIAVALLIMLNRRKAAPIPGGAKPA